MKSNHAYSIDSKDPNYTFRNHEIQYTSSMGGIHFVRSNVFLRLQRRVISKFIFKTTESIRYFYYGVLLEIAIVQKGSEQFGFFSIFKTK